jgi:carnitine 3-dehydrogenase
MGLPSALVDGEGRMLHPPPRWQPGDVVPAPLDFYRGEVLKAWVDYNHHMTEAAYLTAFGWASDALFSYVGDDDTYRAAGHSFYTVETHIAYLR